METLLRQIGFREHERNGDASARVRIRKAFDDEITFPQNRDFFGSRGEPSGQSRS